MDERDPLAAPRPGNLDGLFVMLKLDQLEKGELGVLPSVSADEWQVEMDAKVRAAAESAARLRPYVERARAATETSVVPTASSAAV